MDGIAGGVPLAQLYHTGYRNSPHATRDNVNTNALISTIPFLGSKKSRLAIEELIKPEIRLPKNQLPCIRTARNESVGIKPTPGTTKLFK